MALAGESLVQSAVRIAQTQTVSSEAQPTSGRAVVVARPQATLFQQGQPVLSKSGMKRSTKALIFTALAAGFAASAWKIDHSVLDVTPSSLGTRLDK